MDRREKRLGTQKSAAAIRSIHYVVELKNELPPKNIESRWKKKSAGAEPAE